MTVYIAPEGYDNEYDLSPIFLLSDDDILALEDGEPVTATNKNGDEEIQVQVSENCDKCTATEDEVDELVSVWDYTLCPDCSEKARSYLSDWF